ncbi:MAG TPA: LacI family transcriptional regulator [Succinivibrionaceae bacterium]|nr:LacI family transcriptional regulator [Succinivibrionaceae bacterium]
MANIKDIAKICNVNPATVSRALNGQKGVSDEVRANIVKVAQKLGYAKNPLAASLITNKSGLIGLVVPDITNPYYAAVAKGVAQTLEKEGYAIFLCDSNRNHEQELRYFEMLRNYRVEGVILISVTAKEEDLLNYFNFAKGSPIKVVCVDNPISKNVSTVFNDNYQGACDLIEHMVLKCNVKRLVAVMGTKDAVTTQQRLNGCRETLRRLGKEDILIKTLNISPTYEAGYGIGEEVLRLNPDSVFAINDVVALGLFNYFQHNNVDIPRKIKLAGYDDIPGASMLSVPLTTVHQRKFILGQKAAAQLLYELKNPDAVPIKIELLPKLTVRASCGELL